MDMLSHLRARGCHPERYRLISWDEETASFPLWNLSEQRVGYQQYRADGDKKAFNDPKTGRYYTYCRDNIAVWGIETLDYRHDVLFVTEGIFDAVKLHDLSLPAIAVLANNPKRIRPWINSLARTTVAVCDNDDNDAGRMLAKNTQHALHVQEGKDVGDMSPQEVREFVKFYCPLIWVQQS